MTSIIMMGVGIMMSITVFTVTRRDDQGAGKIGTQDSEQKELAF